MAAKPVPDGMVPIVSRVQPTPGQVLSAPGQAGACIPEGRTAPPAAMRDCRARASSVRLDRTFLIGLAEAEKAAAGFHFGLADQHLVVPAARLGRRRQRHRSACRRCEIASTAAMSPLPMATRKWLPFSRSSFCTPLIV